MQGWRISTSSLFLYTISYTNLFISGLAMEDAHAAVLDLDGEPNSNAFFAVYDGHGGMSI